jgi:hypothetical protein
MAQNASPTIALLKTSTEIKLLVFRRDHGTQITLRSLSIEVALVVVVSVRCVDVAELV